MPKSRYNHKRFEVLQARVREIFSHVRHFELSHDQLLELREQRIFKSPEYSRITRYEIGYLNGMWKTLTDALYADLEHRYLIDTDAGEEWLMTDTMRERGIDLRVCAVSSGGFVWKRSGHIFYASTPDGVNTTSIYAR